MQPVWIFIVMVVIVGVYLSRRRNGQEMQHQTDKQFDA